MKTLTTLALLAVACGREVPAVPPAPPWPEARAPVAGALTSRPCACRTLYERWCVRRTAYVRRCSVRAREVCAVCWVPAN